ncbi:hypothetical protein [Streptomyces sp. HPF1205]|uniref:hypothetical protein n=1 Tax=Streptomyces sp. HPF1205 TaxID=2873262 RepID=UPI001CEC5DD9|nr:hypothetical protein [Streptomyces sp. HPF1205]
MTSYLADYLADLDLDDQQDLEALMMRLAKIIKRKTRRIEALEEQHRALSDEFRKMRENVERQEAKIQYLLARHGQQREDVATDLDVHHHDIAEAYRSFREQKVHSTVRESLRGAGGDRALRRRLLAETMGAVCAELFGQEPPNTEVVEEILSLAPAHEAAGRLCGAAMELRRRAEYLGGDPTWVFDLSPESLSPDQREPWLDAPEDGTPVFVVAPAYQARGKIHCTQLVWTAGPDPVQDTAGS